MEHVSYLPSYPPESHHCLDVVYWGDRKQFQQFNALIH